MPLTIYHQQYHYYRYNIIISYHFLTLSNKIYQHHHHYHDHYLLYEATNTTNTTITIIIIIRTIRTTLIAVAPPRYGVKLRTNKR